MEAGGDYAGIQWTRAPIALNVGIDELVDFQQTFYRATTTVNDSGLYEAHLVTRNATLAFASFKFYVTVYVGKCCIEGPSASKTPILILQLTLHNKMVFAINQMW